MTQEKNRVDNGTYNKTSNEGDHDGAEIARVLLDKTPIEADKQELVRIVVKNFENKIIPLGLGQPRWEQLYSVEIDPTQSPELMEYIRRQALSLVEIDAERLEKILHNELGYHHSDKNFMEWVNKLNPIKLKPK